MQTLPPFPLKRRVLHALERAMYWSGASHAYSAVRGAGATILMYHSVADSPRGRFVDPAWHMAPAAFEAQIRWLVRHRRVVSLDTLVESLERGQTLDAGSVVLTFDDGYLDNLEVAAPILAKYDLPATLYLATGYVEAGETQWVDRLYTAFSSRRRHALDLDGLGAFDLSKPGPRLDAYGQVSLRLIESPRADRPALLQTIREQLQPELLPPRLTMNWDEARRLTERFPDFQLGVHTVDHTDLSNVSEPEAEAQMKDAFDQIETETGRRPRHFSFPYSRTTDATRAMAKRLGFASATGPGTDFLIKPGTDPHDLPRLDPNTDPTLFRFWTSGAYPELPKRLLGRA